ncbi:MAG: 16S rRNA (cytosine(1402)-N(4))-methyltransferase RsmH [Chloroflexi bacterium]|nr:16S rRNA (cytosine(1402)-N(4))-methyltransferase RsmH [Chloroflexota bacterium]
MTEQHIPVLLDEVIEALALKSGARIIDGTLGLGGHSQAILEMIAPDGRVLAFDRDARAIALAHARLTAFTKRVAIIHASYAVMGERAPALGFDAVDGILLDLGFSSLQIDDPERGFAFQHDGPLDMRFDPSQGESAADWVNTRSLDELTRVLRDYGEERHARRIAQAIIAARPITRTQQLAELIKAAQPAPRRGAAPQRIHPATRSFQALRIAVNDELGQLAAALPQAVDLLKPGGRLAVISFHSLEDRLVKRFIRENALEYRYDPDRPDRSGDLSPSLIDLTRKPITASATEISANPRARSAKLRVAARRPMMEEGG